MAATNADTPLILAAARLARAVPREWAEFLKAYEARSDNRRTDLVSSPLDALQVNQGRARECAAAFELLRDCIQTADKIKSKGQDVAH